MWGTSGQLGPPPALPGLRPGRTCRMGALHPTGVASHPLPDLVGEMGPAWGDHVPGTPPLPLAPVGEQGSVRWSGPGGLVNLPAGSEQAARPQRPV